MLRCPYNTKFRRVAECMNFAGEHPDLFLEMTADGEIMVMPPREPSSVTIKL